MKKIILGSTLALSMLLSCAAPLHAEILLESEALRLADGLAIGINADVLEDIGRFIREINELLSGKKDDKGQRLRFIEKKVETGTIKRFVGFEYQGKVYSVKEIVQIEKSIENGNLTPAQRQEKMESLVACLKEVKRELIAIADGFRASIRGTKSTMILLIEESCKKRNRTDSMLMLWAHSKEEDEAALFDAHVNSFAQLISFTDDLMNFLGDLIRSCPKAQDQLRVRMEKWGKIKQIMPQGLGEAAFLKYLKRQHLDKIAANEITLTKIKELHSMYVKQG